MLKIWTGIEVCTISAVLPMDHKCCSSPHSDLVSVLSKKIYRIFVIFFLFLLINVSIPFKATTAAASPKCMEQNGGASVNAKLFVLWHKRGLPKNKRKKNLPGLYPLRLVSAHRSRTSHVGCFFFFLKGVRSIGSPRAGTAARWRWSSPLGSPEGTRTWVSPRGPSSSRTAWAHAESWGTRRDRAFCTPAPPGPAPRGSPSLDMGLCL